MRSRQIVAAARFKAGQRGATAIHTDDLLVGLVLEDRGLLVEGVFSNMAAALGPGPSWFVDRGQPPVPFFSAEAAQDLLSNLNENQSHSQPVPFSAEIPSSPSLKRVFEFAKAFQTQFRHSQIEPLHLLAAILEDSGEGAKVLQRSRITLESVLSALRGTGGQSTPD